MQMQLLANGTGAQRKLAWRECPLEYCGQCYRKGLRCTMTPTCSPDACSQICQDTSAQYGSRIPLYSPPLLPSPRREVRRLTTTRRYLECMRRHNKTNGGLDYV